MGCAIGTRRAEEFPDAYIKEAGTGDTYAPLFQSLDKAHSLTGEALTRRDMLRVVKERCIASALPEEFCNHTFRGTGITVFLHNGGAFIAVVVWLQERSCERRWAI